MAAAARGLLLGWAAAWCCSLAFQIPELTRNSNPGFLGRNLAVGLAIWAGFTLAVCVTTGAIVLLPVSLLVDVAVLRRFRAWAMAAGSACGVYVIGHRLGIWSGLAEGGPDNPLDSQIFWMYTSFAVVFTVATVWSYTRKQQ